MDWNEELKQIREKKLKELMGRAGSGGQKTMPDKPVDLNAASFRELIKAYPLVVVDCWASWCTPCRLIAPIVEELARKYAGKIAFGKLDVDENPEIVSELQIMGVPTLLLFKQGKLVDLIIGAMPKATLEARIARLL